MTSVAGDELSLAQGEILFHLPTKYLDYRNPSQDVASHIGKGASLFKLRLKLNPIMVQNSPSGRVRAPQVKATLSDGITECRATIFANGYRWRGLKGGDVVYVSAKPVMEHGIIFLNQCELIAPYHANRLVPHYQAALGMDADTVNEKIETALIAEMNQAAMMLRSQLQEDVARALTKIKSTFRDAKTFFWAVHRPRDEHDAAAAVETAKRLAAYGVLRDAASCEETTPIEDSRIAISEEHIDTLVSQIPVALTRDQRAAISRICADLRSPFPADHLLSGDVGCGKSMVLFVCAVAAQSLGKQVAILLPNTILAEQIRRELGTLFPHAISRLISSGSDTGEDVASKPILIGTTAIIEWSKKQGPFFLVDLLIVDEQQKIGVSQRTKLASSATNVIEATATAIPRTMGLVLFGKKTITQIKECPVEKRIVTRIAGHEQRAETFSTLCGAVDRGEKVLILYPAVLGTARIYHLAKTANQKDLIEKIVSEGGSFVAADDHKDKPYWLVRLTTQQRQSLMDISKTGDFAPICLEEASADTQALYDRSSVTVAAEKWERLYPGRVALIHGQLSNDDKLDAMRSIREQRASIIISTVIVEIGVTIEGLTTLYVVDAERLGSSTLHQIRGRIARKGGSGLCILGVKCPIGQISEKTADRLNLLATTTDGFKIAESDMQQRGFGDLKKKATSQAGFKHSIFPGHKLLPEDIESVIKLLSFEEMA